MQAKSFNENLVVAAAWAVLAFASTTTSAKEPSTQVERCDRSCLLAVLTEFTEAITDNNVSRLRIAANARMTSNGVVKPIGTGEVWGKVRRIAFRQSFVDPETGSAVFYGTMTNSPTRDGAVWWFYVVRLKIENGVISEIEEIDYDGAIGAVPASSLVMADRIWDAVLPEDERVSREELYRLADLYFSAVSHEVDYRDVPWHPECQRIELGAFTVNSDLQPGSCGGEFQGGRMKWPVVNRRFYIADVPRGIVVAAGDFTAPPEFPDNNQSTVIEVFKVQDGMLRYIEAFFRGNGQKRAGWGTRP